MEGGHCFRVWQPTEPSTPESGIKMSKFIVWLIHRISQVGHSLSNILGIYQGCLNQIVDTLTF